MIRLAMMLAVAVVMSTAVGPVRAKMAIQTFRVQAGAGAHDVYPGPDGAVWFTAQSAGKLGRADDELHSTRAELPFIGDQVGLSRAQLGRPPWLGPDARRAAGYSGAARVS